jgi:hypothetical protein
MILTDSILNLSAGTINVSEPIIINSDIIIRGAGMEKGGTVLVQNANCPLFVIEDSPTKGYNVVLEDIYLGWMGGVIPSEGSNAITQVEKGRLVTNRVRIAGGFYNAIEVSHRFYGEVVFINNSYNNGIYVRTGDMVELDKVKVINTGGTGIKANGLITTLRNCETFQCGREGKTGNNYAIEAKRADIFGGYFNNDYNGLKIDRGSITGAWIEYEGWGLDGTFDNPDADGIIVGENGGGVDRLIVQGTTITDVNRHAINIGSEHIPPRTIINGCAVYFAGKKNSEGQGIYQGDHGNALILNTSLFVGSPVEFKHSWVNANDNTLQLTSDRPAVKFTGVSSNNRFNDNQIYQGGSGGSLVIEDTAQVVTNFFVEGTTPPPPIELTEIDIARNSGGKPLMKISEHKNDGGDYNIAEFHDSRSYAGAVSGAIINMKAFGGANSLDQYFWRAQRDAWGWQNIGYLKGDGELYCQKLKIKGGYLLIENDRLIFKKSDGTLKIIA